MLNKDMETNRWLHLVTAALLAIEERVERVIPCIFTAGLSISRSKVFQNGTLPNSCERFPGAVALVPIVEQIQFILIRAQSVTGIIHAEEIPSADANPETFNGCLTPGLRDSAACV
jgi:hypothetical protein